MRLLLSFDLMLALGFSSLAFFSVLFISLYIIKQKAGTPKMKQISSYIREGAFAFMKREFTTIFYFIVVLALLLYYFLGWQIAIGFIAGSLLSLLAAFIGMNIATLANVRSTEAARRSASKAMKVAFLGGSVTGLSIVGASVLGLTLLYIWFGSPLMLVGFGFGASLAALFAQLGGGIYTKAADIGADLVGKVEKKIPEDDPRNPAVIADLVGDNVGDCAGRGADLFESFSDEIIGAMILGLAFTTVYGIKALVFPLIAQAFGIIATIIGLLFVREWKNLFIGINIPLVVTGIISLLGFYLLSVYYIGDVMIFYTAGLGLLAGVLIALVVQYYTSLNRKPVKEIAKSSLSGAAINVLAGFSYGLESSILPIIIISLVVILAYQLAGFYGIAAASLGILSITGIIMSADTFGPIADNADGIAEMAKVKVKGTEALDAIGNMTKAITKGYAMSCAVLASIVLLFAYWSEAKLVAIDISKPVVLAGLFVGASLPFLFAAMPIKSVSKTAYEIVNEVRRQFKEIKGLLQGKAKADYSKCVDIATKRALQEMILPTLIAIVFPIVVGFLLGIEALAAYIASSTISSALLALTMFNAGGALDNAKKFIEKGNYGGKGSNAHAASVIGDTFGDPLKDTAGPSLHILIKLQSILALTILPLLL